MILTILVAICGCGNENVFGFGNYTFKKIHIDTHHFSGCIEVESWKDNETGIEVKTKDFGSLFLSEGTYMMIEDVCPFCG
jgi:hypothetical protein